MGSIVQRWLSTIQSGGVSGWALRLMTGRRLSRRGFLLIGAATPSMLFLSGCVSRPPLEIPRIGGDVILRPRDDGGVDILLNTTRPVEDAEFLIDEVGARSGSEDDDEDDDAGGEQSEAGSAEPDPSRDATANRDAAKGEDQSAAVGGASYLWEIDARLFGDQCCAIIEVDNRSVKQVAFDNGHLPGTDLPIDFKIRLERYPGRKRIWNMEVWLNRRPIRSVPAFELWMADKADISIVLDGLITDGFGGSGGLNGKLSALGMHLDKGLKFSVTRSWDFSISAAPTRKRRPIRLTALGAEFYSDRFDAKLCVVRGGKEVGKDCIENLNCPEWVAEQVPDGTGVLLGEVVMPWRQPERDAAEPAGGISLRPEGREDRLSVSMGSSRHQVSLIAYSENGGKGLGAAAGRACVGGDLQERPHTRIHCVSGLDKSLLNADRAGDRWLAAFPVDRWDTVEVSGAAGSQIGFAADIPEKPFTLAWDHGRLSMTRDPNRPRITISVDAGVPEAEIVWQTRMTVVDMALAGADSAVFDFCPGPCQVGADAAFAVRPDWIDDPLGVVDEADIDAVLGGADSQTLIVDLRAARLHVLRCVANIDLFYLFQNSRLESRSIAEDPVRMAWNGSEARLAVLTPPQHVVEHAIDEPDFISGKAYDILQTRMAGRSRIAFKLSGKDDGSQYRPLTMHSLIDWSDLEPAVPRRALPRSAGLPDHFDAIEFTGCSVPSVGSWSNADGLACANSLMTALRASLAKRPGDFETAIEAPYRVMLSPSAAARWTRQTVTKESRQGFVPIWNPQIDKDTGDPSVRAIWSPDLRPDYLMENPPTGTEPNNETLWSPWRPGIPAAERIRMPTSQKHRHEFIILTSGFGLPALISLNATGVVDRDRMVIPTDGQGEVRLRSEAGTKLEGIYVPKPILPETFGLTTFGANLALEGNWKPPGPYDSLWPAVNVERWRNISTLGRDIFVEVVEKGYLYPIGVLAAKITITERKFANHPKYGYPVAVTVQRRFLRVTRPEKTYAATYQPFTARGWPVRTLTMITKETPTLIENSKGDPMTGDASISSRPGVAFWPRVTTGKNRADGVVDKAGVFRFDVQFEGLEAPVQMPLMFVDNTAAHDAEHIEKLAEYYNREVPNSGEHEVARDVFFPDSRVSYAMSRKSGDTEFLTKRWRLAVQGRSLPESLQAEKEAAENDNLPNTPDQTLLRRIRLAQYGTDSIMEGADQPPFYPFLAEARVQVQSIKSMTGSPTGEVSVGFHPLYLQHGFDTESNRSDAGGVRNPSEIYLQIRGPAPRMNFSQKGGSSGGIAKPNTAIVALSRSHGTVGGKPSSTPPASLGPRAQGGGFQDLAVAPTSVRTSTTASVDAEVGSFNPLESFIDARFLGLDLSDLLAAALFATGAPKMVEEFMYDVASSLKEPVGELQGIVDAFSRELDETFKFTLDDVEVDWRTLYPVLSDRVDGLSVALTQLYAMLDQANSESSSEAQAAVGRTVQAIEALQHEIKRLLRDPVPALVTEKIDQIKQAAALIKHFPQALQKNAKALIKAAISESSGALKTSLVDLQTRLRGEVDSFFVDLIAKARIDFESRVNERLNSALAEYYNGLRNEQDSSPEKKAEADAVDYAFNALYGRPLGVPTPKRIEGSTPPEYVQTRVYRAICVSELDSPDVGTLRESLYADFVTEPMLQLYNSMRELDRLKQDTLRRLSEVVLNSLRVATRLDELRAVSEDIESTLNNTPNQLKVLCEKHIGPVLGAILSPEPEIRDALGKLDGKLVAIEKEFNKKATQDLLNRYGRRYAGEAHASIVAVGTQVTKSRARLAALLNELTVTKAQFASICGEIGNQAPLKLSESVNRLVSLRNNSLLDLEVLLTRLVDAAAIFGSSQSVVFAAGASCPDLDDLKSLEDLWNCISKDVEQVHLEAAELVQSLSTVKDPKELIEKVKTAETLVRGAGSALADYRTALKDFETKPELTTLRQTALNALKETDTAKVLEGKVLEGLRLTQDYVRTVEKEALALVLEGTTLAEKVRNVALNEALKAVNPVATALYSVHLLVEAGLRRLATFLSGADTEISDFLQYFLTDEAAALLKALANLDTAPGFAEFAADRDALKEISEKAAPLARAPVGAVPVGWSTGLGRARTLKRDWESRGYGIVRLTDGLETALTALLAGDISKLISPKKLEKNILGQVERKLKEMVLRLVPTTLSLSYDWKTELRPFPASDPIFLMNPSSPFWDRDKSPLKGDRSNHFVIDVKGSVDIATADRDLLIKSYLRPFTIKLFPAFDALTVNFKGAYFESGSRGSNFDIQVENVVIGDKLEYIRRLAEMLSPANGPYLDFLGSPPTVIAGFRLDLGSINLGAIAFINIALDVACMLPLDDRRALFRFGLSSRSRPFLISAPPYGGGGSVSVTMEAANLVGFTAGFEGGAVIDLSFGVLKGHGRVTSGVFVTKQAGQSCIIEGFVQAVGECSIACFGISASLGVSLTMAGSNMYGSAWYEFAFKAGFLKFKFGITVDYTLKGGKNQAPGGTSPARSNAILLLWNGGRDAAGEIPEPESYTLIVRNSAGRLVRVYGNADSVAKKTRVEEIFSGAAGTGLRRSDGLVVAQVSDRTDWAGYRARRI